MGKFPIPMESLNNLIRTSYHVCSIGDYYRNHIFEVLICDSLHLQIGKQSLVALYEQVSSYISQYLFLSFLPLQKKPRYHPLGFHASRRPICRPRLQSLPSPLLRGIRFPVSPFLFPCFPLITQTISTTSSATFR